MVLRSAAQQALSMARRPVPLAVMRFPRSTTRLEPCSSTPAHADSATLHPFRLASAASCSTTLPLACPRMELRSHSALASSVHCSPTVPARAPAAACSQHPLALSPDVPAQMISARALPLTTASCRRRRQLDCSSSPCPSLSSIAPPPICATASSFSPIPTTALPFTVLLCHTELDFPARIAPPAVFASSVFPISTGDARSITPTPACACPERKFPMKSPRAFPWITTPPFFPFSTVLFSTRGLDSSPTWSPALALLRIIFLMICTSDELRIHMPP
mmetsp:Transcript_19842/g.47312  ORF Transcript_19842/g.47312 Transcript_19842/m.47312 type:complete len:276 (+) Transcript_19842:890-1717(+)